MSRSAAPPRSPQSPWWRWPASQDTWSSGKGEAICSLVIGTSSWHRLGFNQPPTRLREREQTKKNKMASSSTLFFVVVPAMETWLLSTSSKSWTPFPEVDIAESESDESSDESGSEISDDVLTDDDLGEWEVLRPPAPRSPACLAKTIELLDSSSWVPVSAAQQNRKALGDVVHVHNKVKANKVVPGYLNPVKTDKMAVPALDGFVAFMVWPSACLCSKSTTVKHGVGSGNMNGQGQLRGRGLLGQGREARVCGLVQHLRMERFAGLRAIGLLDYGTP